MTIGINASDPAGSQAKKRLGIGDQEFFFDSVFKIYSIEARQRFFQIDVGKVCAEERLILKPPADRLEKNLR
jgi:hypothetical protein